PVLDPNEQLIQQAQRRVRAEPSGLTITEKVTLTNLFRQDLTAVWTCMAIGDNEGEFRLAWLKEEVGRVNSRKTAAPEASSSGLETPGGLAAAAASHRARRPRRPRQEALYQPAHLLPPPPSWATPPRLRRPSLSAPRSASATTPCPPATSPSPSGVEGVSWKSPDYLAMLVLQSIYLRERAISLGHAMNGLRDV
ncbi:hypothetical protein OC834_007988, partial [Tilletia horrida]